VGGERVKKAVKGERRTEKMKEPFASNYKTAEKYC
jgi:hypothetical protein